MRIKIFETLSSTELEKEVNYFLSKLTCEPVGVEFSTQLDVDRIVYMCFIYY